MDDKEIDMKQIILNEEHLKTFNSIANTKMTTDDFSILKVVGKGSYGKVLLVKKNDDQKVYAMKVLKKKNMIKRNQTEHIKTERRILVKLHNLLLGSDRSPFYNQAKICISKYTEIIFSDGLLRRRRAFFPHSTS